MKEDRKDNAGFSNVYFAFVFDLGYEIKLRALEAKKARNEAGKDEMFETGRLMAYFEIISLMQQSAEGFGIPLSDIRLDDINPERDLT